MCYLDALTEAVVDQMHFKNLLMLFVCVKLSYRTDPLASLAQRRVLNKIINTLTGKPSTPQNPITVLTHSCPFHPSWQIKPDRQR